MWLKDQLYFTGPSPKTFLCSGLLSRFLVKVLAPNSCCQCFQDECEPRNIQTPKWWYCLQSWSKGSCSKSRHCEGAGWAMVASDSSQDTPESAHSTTSQRRLLVPGQLQWLMLVHTSLWLLILPTLSQLSHQWHHIGSLKSCIYILEICTSYKCLCLLWDLTLPLCMLYFASLKRKTIELSHGSDEGTQFPETFA